MRQRLILRGEVEALIRAHEQAGSFMEGAIRGPDTNETITKVPVSLAGQALGHYVVKRLLGSGGMGEVYLAEDRQLGRRVAIKLLPAEFTTDAEWMRRFAQEARATSAFNHPNIITIHEIGERENTHYIVSEGR